MVRASAASCNQSQRKALKGTSEALTRNVHMCSNTCCIIWQLTWTSGNEEFDHGGPLPPENTHFNGLLSKARQFLQNGLASSTKAPIQRVEEGTWGFVRQPEKSQSQPQNALWHSSRHTWLLIRSHLQLLKSIIGGSSHGPLQRPTWSLQPTVHPPTSTCPERH